MNNTKHTPGPWDFRVYGDGCFIVSRHDEPGTSVRAQLRGVRVKVDAIINDNQSNAHEASPDARAISAVPEFIAACRQLIFAYTTMGGAGDPEISSAYIKALHAMEKAGISVEDIS